MWELATASVRVKDQVESFLKDGYEPFAVTNDGYGERVWLKKERIDSAFVQVGDNLIAAMERVETAKTVKELKDEILQQQSKPVQRRSRGATAKPRKKVS